MRACLGKRIRPPYKPLPFLTRGSGLIFYIVIGTVFERGLRDIHNARVASFDVGAYDFTILDVNLTGLAHFTTRELGSRKGVKGVG
jgi:hypothetical protein